MGIRTGSEQFYAIVIGGRARTDTLYPAVEDDDRFVLRVPVPRAKLAARLVPGMPLGLATWMPFEYWATAEMLPDIYLA